EEARRATIRLLIARRFRRARSRRVGPDGAPSAPPTAHPPPGCPEVFPERRRLAFGYLFPAIEGFEREVRRTLRRRYARGPRPLPALPRGLGRPALRSVGGW